MHSYSVLSSRWKILAALLLPGIVHASDQLLTVARGTDVLNVWRADQHLYVKGDIGVSPALLHDLEKWLDRNGTNWTILLAQNAAGESYTDATGATFTGMDAVENALGQGLPNRTAFGQLTEPLTGEPNAAYFILFLQERKFSYYGSTAQDRRALGEDQWQGNLDRPAIAAMRSGGRIIDAVKDTVGNINDRLTQKIRSDQRQRERQAAQAEEAKQRAQQRAETELASAQEALTRLAAAGSAVPILLPLQLQWTNAQTLLAGNDPVRAATEATKTRQAAEAALRSLDELERAPELFRKLESSLARQRQRPHWQAGQVQLGQAEKSLAAAKVAAEEGRLEFSIHGQAAERSLDAAERVIIQAAKLQQIRRVLLMAGGGALALLAIGCAWGLTRRRRSVKAEAELLYQSWDAALKEKNSALVQLLEKLSNSVGSSRVDANSRWTGETLVLAQQIIRDVDELFIMAACAGRVLRDAQRLLFPNGPWAGCARRFSKGPYLRTLALLRDQRIAFQPEESLELIVKGSKQTWQSLLGDLSTYQPFEMSFQDLMSGFHERAQRAVANLETFEISLRDIAAFLKSLERDLMAVRTATMEILQAASGDGMFALESLSASVLPTLEATLTDITARQFDDPVDGMRNRGATLAVRIGFAQQLLGTAQFFRTQVLPRLTEARGSFAAARIATGWLDESMEVLSERGEKAASALTSTLTTDEVDALRQDVAGLDRHVQDLLQVERERQTKVLPELERVKARLNEARATLAQTLRIGPEMVFAEKDLRPEVSIDAAGEQGIALKAALDRGDVQSARDAMATMGQLTAAADDLIVRTEKAHRDYPGEAQARQNETQRLLEVRPGQEQLLVQLVARYQPAALLREPDDRATTQQGDSIADNGTEIDRHLTAIESLRQEAADAFRTGRLLEAVGRLDQIKAHQESISARLQEITDQEQLLVRTEEENNQRLAELDRRLKDSASLALDARILPATLSQHTQAETLLERAQASLALQPRDPFLTARTLAELDHAIVSLQDMARCDFDLHAEAERSLAAAAAQLDAAGQLANQAAADAIADSAAILQARQALDVSDQALREARAQFQKPHSDWRILDVEADRLSSELARHAATLRGELEAAELAARAASLAATAVRAASGWTGMLGVQILGSPGGAELENARARLLQGDYQGSRQFAAMAQRNAERAIAVAEAEMARRRRAEQEERERQRRHRQAAEAARAMRQSNWGSSASSGRRSSFGSGSGAGRSSFSSRSGASRSGW